MLPFTTRFTVHVKNVINRVVILSYGERGFAAGPLCKGCTGKQLKLMHLVSLNLLLRALFSKDCVLKRTKERIDIFYFLFTKREIHETDSYDILNIKYGENNWGEL